MIILCTIGKNFAISILPFKWLYYNQFDEILSDVHNCFFRLQNLEYQDTPPEFQNPQWKELARAINYIGLAHIAEFSEEDIAED